MMVESRRAQSGAAPGENQRETAVPSFHHQPDQYKTSTKLNHFAMKAKIFFYAVVTVSDTLAFFQLVRFTTHLQPPDLDC
jgi:hypothetical protein